MRAEPSDAPRDFHHPELDGLRFFAFLAVFLHHALPEDRATWMSFGAPRALAAWIETAVLAGSLGVDFFLCLSAFLITSLLLRERRTYGRVAYGAFLVRRALRIWPLYYAFLAFVLLVWPRLTGQSLSTRQALAFGTFVSNWECGFFGYPMSILAPLWSIALEEQLYLVWPLLLHMRTRRMAQVLVGLVVLAATARALHVLAGGGAQMLWCSTFTRLDPIALGGLLGIVAEKHTITLRPLARRVLMLGAVGAILVTAYAVPLHRDPLTLFVVPSFTLTAASCSLLLFAVLRSPGEPKSVFSRPLLVYLGRISYGLYVFHMLGLTAARWLLAKAHVSGLLAEVCLGLVVTTALAIASHRLLEEPFLRLKGRFSPARRSAPQAAAPNSEEPDAIFAGGDTNRM